MRAGVAAAGVRGGDVSMATKPDEIVVHIDAEDFARLERIADRLERVLEKLEQPVHVVHVRDVAYQRHTATPADPYWRHSKTVGDE